MTTLVICEKPSQARNVAAAIGTRYGEVLPCQGHLLRLELPDEVNPDWKKWNQDILFPPKGLYGYIPDNGSGKGPRFTKIKQALQKATHVIIATDCDREGQGIGQSILDLLKFKGDVKRAIFTAEDATSLIKAFASAKANVNFETLYQAFIARQQADQIYNLTLTRVATTVLRAPNTQGVIGVGRVRSPTLGILCRREKEIEKFKSLEYFEVVLEVEGPSGAATLKHAPDEKHRILERQVAETIAAAARTFEGPISVVTERKSKAPPRPFDLPSLEQRANTLWGWTVKKTDEIAQKLYEEFKVTTYPRAEAQYLPETMIPEVPALFGQLTQLPEFSDIGFSEPRVRKGADGVFNDKKLEGMSHHAIIPNINCPGGFRAAMQKLNHDEARLFNLIASRYLAALGPDYIYDQTTISLLAPVPTQGPTKFSATGSVPVSAGWRGVETDIDDIDEAQLPKLKNGETVRATDAKVAAKWTEPPKRYTEAGLIKAMQEAWRFVEDPAQRERLKEAKGLGTPATRSTIIEGLKSQGQVQLDKKNLVPTQAGMLIYDVFAEVAPVVMDPAATARMEARLDDILTGKATAKQVISEITQQARWITDRIKESTTRVDLTTAKKFKKGSPPAARSQPATRAGAPKPASSRSAPSYASPNTATGQRPAARPTTTTAKPTPPVAKPPPPGCIYLRVPPPAQFEAHRMGAVYDKPSGRFWITGTADRRPFQQKGWL